MRTITRDEMTRDNLNELKHYVIDKLSELLPTENVNEAKLGLMIARVANIILEDMENVTVFFDTDNVERALFLYVLSMYVTTDDIAAEAFNAGNKNR